MMSRSSHRSIGIAAIVLAVFLITVGIPFGITAPSNISNIVLSPRFWPEIVAAIMGLAGLALIWQSRRLTDEAHEGFLNGVPGASMRLLLMAAMMALYVFLIPVLGMVWASMLAFLATAFLLGTRRAVRAGVAAILAPLLLYAFFAHTAGVAIPQGQLLRLP